VHLYFTVVSAYCLDLFFLMHLLPRIDGTCVFSIFMSFKPIPSNSRYPMPDLPEGWSPNPKRLWEKDKENLDTSSKKENDAPSGLVPTQPPSHAQWKTGISANEVSCFRDNMRRCRYFPSTARLDVGRDSSSIGASIRF
jgi:hypothetical protein